MRLDFNILWVEDQPSAIKAQFTKMERLIRGEGFRADACYATSVADAKGVLGDNIFSDHVDLILMDYDLGSGPDGSAGIEAVRDFLPFKDIIFYSASGIQKLKASLSKNDFQGVYYSSRQDLPDTVFGVFESLVKKVVDIEHSRGIVMGATSEIDYFINKSIASVFAKADEKLKAKALKLIAEQLKENRKTFDKESEKVGALIDLVTLADFHHVFTSAHRLRLLRKILEEIGTHETECTSMIKYAETMPQRNVLAHTQVVRNGFSRKLFTPDDKEITLEDMRALRIDLLEHHELFERLLKLLHHPQK